jgi:transposase-like protein
MSDYSNPIFHDATKAREWLEATLWPNGPICPHCGVVDEATLLKGDATRPGVYKCRACRAQFTVTVGTIYERSHVPLNTWLAATQLLMSSKKGMSSLQIARLLKVNRRTAWFLMHRIRETLRPMFPDALGGEGKTVEIDETFVGGKAKNQHASKRKHVGTGGAGKEAVFSLVEREGKVRSFHVASVNAKTLRPIIQAHVDGKTLVLSDEGPGAKMVSGEFALHDTVNHGIGEYVRGDIHTNTIESYFAILKRGIVGTYHSVSQQHLKRYLAEFDFRYNERQALEVTDFQRMEKSIAGVVGKRLTYRRTRGAEGYQEA